MCLIMELAKGGNLHQRIKDPAKPKLCYKEVLQVGTYSHICSVTAMPKLLHVTRYITRYATKYLTRYVTSLQVGTCAL